MWGTNAAFEYNLKQVVHIRSVREAKKNKTLPTVARLSVWNTLLLPEVVFIIQEELRFLLVVACVFSKNDLQT